MRRLGSRTNGAVFRCVGLCAVLSADLNNYRCLISKRCRRPQSLSRLPPLGFCFGAASEFLGSESPCAISVKPSCENHSQSGVLIPYQSQPVQPCSHCELFVLFLLFLRAGCFEFLCHLCYCKRKLYVGFELSCIQTAFAVCCGVIELPKPVLDSPVCKHRVVIKHCIPT